ncbi:unnamed protein product, partial [Amoebophrya sp. A25]|eukprot:GSA25T00006574001.1
MKNKFLFGVALLDRGLGVRLCKVIKSKEKKGSGSGSLEVDASGDDARTATGSTGSGSGSGSGEGTRDEPVMDDFGADGGFLGELDREQNINDAGV